MLLLFKIHLQWAMTCSNKILGEKNVFYLSVNNFFVKDTQIRDFMDISLHNHNLISYQLVATYF